MHGCTTLIIMLLSCFDHFNPLEVIRWTNKLITCTVLACQCLSVCSQSDIRRLLLSSVSRSPLQETGLGSVDCPSTAEGSVTFRCSSFYPGSLRHQQYVELFCFVGGKLRVYSYLVFTDLVDYFRQTTQMTDSTLSEACIQCTYILLLVHVFTSGFESHWLILYTVGIISFIHWKVDC